MAKEELKNLITEVVRKNSGIFRGDPPRIKNSINLNQ